MVPLLTSVPLTLNSTENPVSLLPFRALLTTVMLLFRLGERNTKAAATLGKPGEFPVVANPFREETRRTEIRAEATKNEIKRRRDLFLGAEK